MKRKSIAQEYLMLVMDKNGILPPMRKEESKAGLVLASFMELLLGGIITVEKKKIIIEKDLQPEFMHLASLYAYLEEKPRTKSKMISDYSMGIRLNKLIDEIGESLFADGLVTKGEGGLFGPKITYIANQEQKGKLIDIIKSVIEKEDKFTEHDLILIFLLQKTKNLSQYLSKYEKEKWNSKLKAVKKDSQNKELARLIHYVDDSIAAMMIVFMAVYI
ncbi:MAG TPA: GPP34 family phosphoprotein [Candidatus Anaerostipes excrementavium]|uniref:GPP34 family phosphoprotein n=1 Tax=Candidatus Anaerostipes excrementavium TaxID=2838463 RepID=A0A9D2BAJ1_9FIRM|nr:GPP34 family phosphoprotein [uncultured Anaerostipes sp.]HIX69056.1 GPP34 family phosphoprotein [Candidatus Anaerostipes excrementavium]